MAQFSTATAPALDVSRPRVDRGCMTMTLAYAIALAEARSCLAALVDTASAFEESIRYEHLLFDLDALHPIGPTLYATTGTKPDLLGPSKHPSTRCSTSAKATACVWNSSWWPREWGPEMLPDCRWGELSTIAAAPPDAVGAFD